MPGFPSHAARWDRPYPVSIVKGALPFLKLQKTGAVQDASRIHRGLAGPPGWLLARTNGWLTALVTTGVRCGAAGRLMLTVSWRTLRPGTWVEARRGMGLGLFGGTGILL